MASLAFLALDIPASSTLTRDQATGSHLARLGEDLAHVLLGWLVVSPRRGCRAGGYRGRLTGSGAGWRAGWPAAGACPLRCLE